MYTTHSANNLFNCRPTDGFNWQDKHAIENGRVPDRLSEAVESYCPDRVEGSFTAVRDFC
jgi:hypothetical protein